MKSSVSRSAFVVLVALVLLASTRESYAQQMSFSYYTDAVMSDELDVLYTVVSGSDNSSGCTHYDYQNYAYVNGPTGFYDSYSSGMSAYFNVPVAEGDYSISSSVTVNCSCFGSGLGAGGAWDVVNVRAFTARMLWSPIDSDPPPHDGSSKDVYLNDGCAGYCQPASVQYNHGVGMGHLWIEIKGFDTQTVFTRTCKARANTTLSPAERRIPTKAVEH